MAHPAIISAVEALFELARAKDIAAFRARFTPASVTDLEARWHAGTANGSWPKMMAALVGPGETSPRIVSVETDADEDPTEATVTIALDGRQHTLYLQRDLEPLSAWRVEVRERNTDILNVEVRFAGRSRRLIEISFGTGLGIPGEHLFNYGDGINPAPLASLWLTGELFVLPWLRLGAIYDLPTGLQVLQVRGETVEEYTPSRLLAGVTWTPLFIDFAAQSRLEMQLLTYAGLTLEGVPRWVPMFGGRAAILQNAHEGADIYLGLYYQGGVDFVGLLYGVGYRF